MIDTQTQRTQPMTIRITTKMLADIDRASCHLEMSRASFIRDWLDRGLQHWRTVDRHKVAKLLEETNT